MPPPVLYRKGFFRGEGTIRRYFENSKFLYEGAQLEDFLDIFFKVLYIFKTQNFFLEKEGTIRQFFLTMKIFFKGGHKKND